MSAHQTLIGLHQQYGYHWWHDRRLIDLGDALLGRDGVGDREGAERAYRQSLEMFTEMGAPGYVQVLEDRFKALG